VLSFLQFFNFFNHCRFILMKNKHSVIALLGIGLLVLASCATKYAPATGSFWDGHTGYSEVGLDSTTWQVTFCGNNNTTDDVVNRYALYRSAELTSQRGFDYFVVLDNNDVAAITSTVNHNNTQKTEVEHKVDPQTGRVVPVTVTTNNGSSTVTTQAAHTVTKTIRMFQGDRPSEDPNAFDAKSMVTMMAPSIQR
jgi:hypothetical protein